MKNFSLLQKKYVVNTFPNRGLVLVEGSGAYLKDDSGEEYLDLMTNYGVNIFGYGHPEITGALVRQLQRLTSLHGSFVSDTRAEAAQALVNRCGGGVAQVYFANSGAEANEAALKFAVLATGRKRFVVCRCGYHGKTLGALSATDGIKYREAFEPLLWDFARVDFNSPAALEEALDERTAAFIVEPIQGEGGIQVPDPGYLQQAKKLCESKGSVLILDEIQTGTGRLGHFLASHPEGIAYDILCLGKGLAGGLPVGATLVNPKIAERIPRLSHTSTFGGNPLVAAGILATLRILDDGMLSRIQSIGEYFLQGLQGLKSDLIVGVKGKGLMIGLEVREKRDDILRELQRQNVLAIPAADGVVRFLPPYILEKEQVDFALDRLEKSISLLS